MSEKCLNVSFFFSFFPSAMSFVQMLLLSKVGFSNSEVCDSLASLKRLVTSAIFFLFSGFLHCKFLLFLECFNNMQYYVIFVFL